MIKKMTVLIVLGIIFLFTSCQTGLFGPNETNDSIDNASNSVGIYKDDFNPKDVINPIMEYLVQNPNWLSNNNIDVLVEGPQPVNNYISSQSLNLTEIYSEYDYIDQINSFSFKIDSLVYEVRIYFDAGTVEHINTNDMINRQIYWGLMFDPDYYGDKLEGELYLSNIGGEVSKEWVNIEEAPDFPIVFIKIEEKLNYERIKRGEKRIDAINNGSRVMSDYLVVLGIQMQYDHEGKNRGSAEFEIYVGPDGTYDRYPSQTDHIFDGDYHVDAAGRNVYYPDVNKEGIWYIPSTPISLFKLTGTHNYIIPIESDTGPAGNHNNDENATNPSRYVHDVTGYDMYSLVSDLVRK